MIRAKQVVLDIRKCVQCGMCAGLCSYGALTLKRPEMVLQFKPEYCVGCELCMEVCPTRAIGTEPQ